MTEEERKLLLLVAKNLIYSNNTNAREFLDYDDKRNIKNLIEKIENK